MTALQRLQPVRPARSMGASRPPAGSRVWPVSGVEFIQNGQRHELRLASKLRFVNTLRPSCEQTALQVAQSAFQPERFSMDLVETLKFTIHDDEAAAEAAVVEAGLDATNAAVPALCNVQPLAVYARDAIRNVVGGAVGRTWGQCCELRQLWVDPRCRARGVGSELVRVFERQAIDRKCRLLYLETFSFQARPFYEKLGYAIALEIRGFDDGIIKYVMTRVLSEPRVASQDD